MTLDDGERALLVRWQQEMRGDLSEPDETDHVLRVMGLSPNQRQEVRRSRGRSDGTRSGHSGRIRYQDQTLKRFEWYIQRRVPSWNDVPFTPAEVAATWAKLTEYKLELAQRWWDAGLDPLAVEHIADLVGEGLAPADLATRVGNRTIAEHLSRGCSVKWCLMAAGWATSPNIPSPRRTTQYAPRR